MESGLNWQTIVEPVRPFLDAVSRRLEEQLSHFEPEIVEPARYALASRGKQLRPALVGLAATAAGGVRDEHVTVAAIIEMVHLATLVHDDVMDEADMRRQRPTLALEWGNSTAILLGDALFAHALTMAAAFPTTDVCRAVASATRTVCSGEIIQTMRRCQFELSREGYYRILRMKTAELFSLACGQGAALAQARADVVAALQRFGVMLGTAYQVYDDCVDLVGLEERAGKSLGTDLLRGKPTLPVIIAMERATPAERNALRSLLTDWKPGNHPLLVASLQRYDAIAAAVDVVCGMCAEAAETLELLPARPGRTALQQAADFLARHTQLLIAQGRG
ncbi:MAG: polyprenyl synthetase family protein [Verrucomicrobiae bacterium]|nr:polyprenyl synthetase family protein [Verrucomicrobiae bacterium]MCP5521463.1 polyprenyl synthetase family protein [Verrucomicrobiales bacterium]